MANESDQIEIELDDADKKAKTTEKDDIKVEKAEEAPEKDEIAAADGVEELKKRLEEERQLRVEAEKRAREYAERETSARNEVQDSNLTLVTNAIETVKQNNSILKANYKEAMSIGDFDKAAEIQEALSSNSAKLLQLEQGKQALENMPKHQSQMPSDPVEALASQLSPRSADWIRRNPQCATDQRLFQKMLAAHNLAMADGIVPDSDEYFEFVESTINIKQAAPRKVEQVADEDPTAAAAKPTQRRTSPPAAPVTRGGERSNVVRLTAQEREMAQMMGMTDKEYATHKLALQKEGKLN
jgi:hypothetical protein